MPWLVRSLSAGSKQTELRTLGREVALWSMGFLSIQSGTCLLTVRGVVKGTFPGQRKRHLRTHSQRIPPTHVAAIVATISTVLTKVNKAASHANGDGAPS